MMSEIWTNREKIYEWVENIVGNGRKCLSQAISPFPSVLKSVGGTVLSRKCLTTLLPTDESGDENSHVRKI